MDELTPLQQAERDAILASRGDSSVFVVVSALRRYRAEVAKLLASRYTDGECDSASLHSFACAVQEIEEYHHDDSEEP